MRGARPVNDVNMGELTKLIRGKEKGESADALVKTLGLPAFERDQIVELLEDLEKDGLTPEEIAYEIVDYYDIEDDVFEDEDPDDDDDFGDDEDDR
jgi:hypothetical protein